MIKKSSLKSGTESYKSSDRKSLLHCNSEDDSKITEVKIEQAQSKDSVDKSHCRRSREIGNDGDHKDKGKQK